LQLDFARNDDAFKMNLYLLATEEFHDIAPPVDYSLLPPWLVFVIAFIVLSLVGLVVWWLARRRKPELPPKLPREIALGELEQSRREIEMMSPYQFSIRVSDILRRYVTQQYGLPATRQTSIEFLTAAAKAPSFSADEKSLLEDFLNRCDLIKFARYEATTSDSELLLEEAIRFVKGTQLVVV
jgi:hypothetical protein